MDASLEDPTTLPTQRQDSAKDDAEHDEQLSGEDDEGLDWAKILSSVNRPVIPKRGEKEFEPARGGGGSGLQAHILETSRSAMFDALRATRSISSKNISHGIWYPAIARAHITQARGVHFGSMGHSVPHPIPGLQSLQKRMELLPEEALYLVERGALLCWKETGHPISATPGLTDIYGSPMTVQQAFAEMLGKEGLSLEHYQVYAYLKRLGYAIIRAQPPSPHYPSAAVPLATGIQPQSILTRLVDIFQRVMARLCRTFSLGLNWWRPVRILPWLHHNKTYSSIFKSLRFIPASHHHPIFQSDSPTEPSPYRVFYHIYKPSTPFRKTAPPPPDYSITVVNARTTHMPSLRELTVLYDELPELPPPVPRRRGQQQHPPRTPASEPPTATSPALTRPPSDHASGFWRVLTFWKSPNQKTVSAPTNRPNPFAVLKVGKKAAIVAVVDSGSISFFKFGQGVFPDWPMQ